jgi:hypothetical protein
METELFNKDVIEDRNEKMVICIECGGVGANHSLGCSRPSVPTTDGVDVEFCIECGLYGGSHLGGCIKYSGKDRQLKGYDDRTNAERERDEAIHELTEALRFTVEYIGVINLPPIEGWSWYDAMVKYAPTKAEAFRRMYEVAIAPTLPHDPEEVLNTNGVSD